MCGEAWDRGAGEPGGFAGSTQTCTPGYATTVWTLDSGMEGIRVFDELVCQTTPQHFWEMSRCSPRCNSDLWTATWVAFPSPAVHEGARCRVFSLESYRFLGSPMTE
jgi:hypothetical protein